MINSIKLSHDIFHYSITNQWRHLLKMFVIKKFIWMKSRQSLFFSNDFKLLFYSKFLSNVYYSNVVISERFPPRFRRRRYRPLTPKDLPMTGSESSWRSRKSTYVREKVYYRTKQGKHAVMSHRNLHKKKETRFLKYGFCEVFFLRDLVNSLGSLEKKRRKDLFWNY